MHILSSNELKHIGGGLTKDDTIDLSAIVVGNLFGYNACSIGFAVQYPDPPNNLQHSLKAVIMLGVSQVLGVYTFYQLAQLYKNSSLVSPEHE